MVAEQVTLHRISGKACSASRAAALDAAGRRPARLVALNVANAIARATGIVVIGVDEVLVFGMIWMVMLGMLLVTAERSHIALEILSTRVGPRMALALSILTHSVMMMACGYAALQSFYFVQRVSAPARPVWRSGCRC